MELTPRAVGTGMMLGALLTPCNVYSGLKIGWSFNMSIAAGLLAAGIWGAAGRFGAARPWGLYENNINQTAASSSASIVSAGLVAPIPALTLLTGATFSWPVLAVWVFVISLLGVVVAAGIRHHMIVTEGLRFPAGVATAETITQIHARGTEAARRLRLLLSAAVVSGGVKAAVELAAAVPRLALPGAVTVTGAGRVGLANLGFAFDPSLLMLGFGAIIGWRAGLSLLIGAILAWGIIAPVVLSLGWVEPGAPGSVWYEPLVGWLLWPGVMLLAVSALVSLASFLFGFLRRKRGPRTLRLRGGYGYPLAIAATALMVTIAAVAIFGLSPVDAIIAVAVSFVLAAVAARVTGETGITPIGALGKITQLTYAGLTPGDVTANLMTANITGGAAGQCADLMDDLKTGYLIGATPNRQMVAQTFGVLTGSLVGTLVYLVLVPDPRAMLLTPEWPAPAVVTWKAVAEVLSRGVGAIPPGALPAMAVAAVLGLLSGLAERFLPLAIARRLPSAPALGLAFVIPAWTSISLFLGALGALVLARLVPLWAERRTVTLAAGLVAGESLVGVGFAVASLMR
ncbi:MAG: OPT family oligopeptide transporter [Alphaproteobacteria bacterium]|nr:OPT family oligopeptide transporter [Alphaproteobacteria bacterium]